jgi:fructokinase
MFGEVLFDMFPDGSVILGGAPFNVAWHLQAFGLEPLLISRVGADALGRQVAGAMLDWGMDRSGLQIDSAHPTGTVNITFSDGEPQFDIVADRAFDYIDRYAIPPYWSSRPLYYGSLAMRRSASKETLRELKSNSEGLTFMDVNLRPPWWSLNEVVDALTGAGCIKVNHDELNQIVHNSPTIESKVKWLLVNASAQSVLVTRGKEGAMMFMSDGSHLSITPKPALRVVDTVGAGDAFSSVMLMGQIKKWPIGLTLDRAQSFASAIVGVRGAVVKDMKFYHDFIQQWHNEMPAQDSVSHGDREHLENESI